MGGWKAGACTSKHAGVSEGERVLGGWTLTFANSILGADHGVVFEDMKGEIDLGNRSLVGHGALERVRAGSGHGWIG